MLAIFYLIGTFVADLFRSRRRLEAENLFLRHQLNIILRRAPHGLRLRTRSQSDYQASQVELQQAQKNCRSAQDELQRVRTELEEATGRLAKEETARLALEIDNVKLRDERQRLNGILTAQQDDLRKLSNANINIKRRIRRAAIAASVIVAVGLTTWFSGAHALFLAGH